jgi:hypothetical protein
MPKPWTTIDDYMGNIPTICDTAKHLKKQRELLPKVMSNHRSTLNPPRKLR